jgi:hypothetical protein
MLLYGAIAGWVMYERKDYHIARVDTRKEAQQWTS